MSPEHEQHTIMLSRDRRAYLWLPHDLTEAEWERLLAWLAFTRPAIVSEATPVGATDAKPDPDPNAPMVTGVQP